MAKFRKRPVVVEAQQFWPDKPLPFYASPIVCYDGEFYVTTIHGERATLTPGDWVILEPRGLNRAYPCKPDIFEATYEPVDSPAQVAPQPDWTQAPAWAQWWAVDATGAANWYASKPETADDVPMWWSDDRNLPDLPDMFGIDWRTTLRRRPAGQE